MNIEYEEQDIDFNKEEIQWKIYKTKIQIVIK